MSVQSSASLARFSSIAVSRSYVPPIFIADYAYCKFIARFSLSQSAIKRPCILLQGPNVKRSHFIIQLRICVPTFTYKLASL
jgi:hypothetical protein